MDEDQAKTDRLTIGQRITKVREEVDYVQKTTKIDKKYPVVTHDVVTANLRPAMVKYGIITPVDLVEGQFMKTERTTKDGTPYTTYYGVFKVFFCCDDNPDEHVSCTVPGAGDDYGDKGPGKALSLAVKNAFLKMFNLETGENEESRIQPKMAGPTLETRTAFDEAVEIAQALGRDIEKATKTWTKWYKVDSLDDLTDLQMTDTTVSINAWIEKNEPKGEDLNDDNDT